MLQPRLMHLLYAMAISLPLWGFSVVNIGTRGIRIDWVVAGLLAFVFYLNFCCHKNRLSKDSIWIWLLILNLAVLLSFYTPLSSKNHSMIEDYLTAWLQFILGMALFVAICNIELETRDLTRIIKLYVIIGAVIASFGIIQLMGSYWGHELRLSFTNVGRADPHSGYEVITGAFKRPTSFFSEPRQFGNYLVPIWSVLFIVILSKLPIFKKHISYLFGIIILLSIISSLSASAYFTLLTSSFVLSIYFFRKKGFKKLFGFLVLVFFIVLAMSASLRQPETDFMGIILRRMQQFANITRVYTQLQSIEYNTFGLFHYVGNIRLAYDTWMQSPLIGVGLNNLEYYSKYGLSGAHPPFRFLAETGILGVISFLGLIIVFLRKYKKLLRRLNISHIDNSLALIGIFLILTTIIASFGSTYGYYSTFFWFNLSLAGLIYFNLKRKYSINFRTIQGGV